jgi:beta-galactosidase
MAYGLNRYFQWYYGTSETQLGQNLDDIHAASPAQMIGVSEYGAGNALTHHTDNVYGGRVCSRDTSGFTRICYQPEGYANYVHEKAYAQIVSRPYLMGSWIWNMFDFGSGNRHEGDIGQTNTKGIVTFGRDVKKDVFHFYKANWTATPVTYITGRRYSETGLHPRRREGVQQRRLRGAAGSMTRWSRRSRRPSARCASASSRRCR